MSDLNTLLNKLEIIEPLSREVIIINVLVKYHNSYSRENQSIHSRELINLLRNDNRTLQDKINDIKVYLQDKCNQNRRLFNYFVAEIEDIWQKEFCPSYQLNNEFISWAQSKNLHLLNERGKQSIMSEVVKNMDAQKKYIRNPDSHSLMILLKQDDNIESKWQSLLAYARSWVNINEVAYDSIIKAINHKLADVNATRDVVLMTQINNHTFYNELVSEQSKRAIIEEVVNRYLAKPSLMPSEESAALFNILQGHTASLNVKWDHLVAYYANSNNIYRNLYNIIRDVAGIKLDEQYAQLIKHFNSQYELIQNYMQQENYQQAIQLLEDYLLTYRKVRYPDTNVLINNYSLLAECYSKCGNNDKAIKAYQDIFILRNNELETKTKVEILLKLFSCYLANKDYKNAFITSQTLNEIWLNSVSHDRAVLESLIAKQSQLRNQLIREDGYLKYVKSYTAIDSSDYRSLFFRESAGKGTIIGAATGAAIVYVGTKLDILGLLIVPAGVAVSAAGVVPGAFFGSIHGLFRAASRKPLNRAEQLTLIDHLNKFAAVDDQQKDLFIRKVVKQYHLTKTLSASDSSEKLMLDLTNTQLTPAVKWQQIVAYILAVNDASIFHSKETVIYKNNGKRLFCIINEILRERLADVKENSPSIKM